MLPAGMLYSPFAHFYQFGHFRFGQIRLSLGAYFCPAKEDRMTKKYNAREKKQRRLAKERRKKERIKEVIAKAHEGKH